MTTPAKPDRIAETVADITAELHALLLEHPEYVTIGAEGVVDIFRTGVLAGIDATRRVMQ